MAIPPLDRDPNADPDQDSLRQDKGALDLSSLVRHSWERVWGALPADKAQTLFNSLLVLVGFLQWKVYKTQTKIMQETREISSAALGRPHVFFHFASHSFDEWREGKVGLWFAFRFINYGTSPAIIRQVTARVFLSRGPGAQEDGKSSLIENFPEAHDFTQFIAQTTPMYVMEGKHDDPNFNVFAERAQRFWDHMFIISPKERTGVFGTSALVNRQTRTINYAMQKWHNTYLYDVTSERLSDGGWVRPWLAGQITYDDTFGRRHHTNFCIRANRDGTVSYEEESPYDERT